MSHVSFLGIAGTYVDPSAGAYPLGRGYRWYLPALMRFGVPDSWSPFGPGGIHAYVYCADEPINLSDPSGHLPKLLDALDLATKDHPTFPVPSPEDRPLVTERAVSAPPSIDDSTIRPTSRRRRASTSLRNPSPKRMRVGEIGEPGPQSQQAALIAPPPSYEQVRANVTNDLGALEVSIRQQIDPLFNEGDPSIRTLYHELSDFERLIPRINQIEARVRLITHDRFMLDDLITWHQERLRDIQRRIPMQWETELARAHRLGQALEQDSALLEAAWSRNPANEERIWPPN